MHLESELYISHALWFNTEQSVWPNVCLADKTLIITINHIVNIVNHCTTLHNIKHYFSLHEVIHCAFPCFALLGGGCCSQLASYQWTQLMMPIAAILAHNCHHRPESHHHLHYPHFPFFTVLKILTGNMSSWKKYIFHICSWLTLLNCVEREILLQNNSCIPLFLKSIIWLWESKILLSKKDTFMREKYFWQDNSYIPFF